MISLLCHLLVAHFLMSCCRRAPDRSVGRSRLASLTLGFSMVNGRNLSWKESART